MKLAPVESGKAGKEDSPVAAEASVSTQRMALADLVEAHGRALMMGDQAAAEAYGLALQVVAGVLRHDLVSNNRADGVAQGLKIAMQAIRYLDEKREAQAGRLVEDADLAERRRRVRAELDAIEADARQRLALPKDAEDPLAQMAIGTEHAGSNSMTRKLSAAELEAEERGARERAKEMQRMRDARNLEAHEAERRRLGRDAEDEGNVDQQQQERLQAQIEAEERLKARRAQVAKDGGGAPASLPGGVIGAGEELSFEEVQRRAQEGPRAS